MSELNSNILQELFRYKKRLETNIADKEEILDCLYDLFDVQITTNYLQETLIGKTVNAFRHDEDVGLLAQNLIRKWKNIVIDENDGSDSDSDSDSDSLSAHNSDCSAYDSDSCLAHDNDSVLVHDSDSVKANDNDSMSVHDSDSGKVHDNNAVLVHDSDSCSAYDSDVEFISEFHRPRDGKLPEEELINLCKKSVLEVKLTRINPESPPVIKTEVTENNETPSVTEVDDLVPMKEIQPAFLLKSKAPRKVLKMPESLEVENFKDVVSKKEIQSASKTVALEKISKKPYVDLSPYKVIDKILENTSLGRDKTQHADSNTTNKNKKQNICPKVR